MAALTICSDFGAQMWELDHKESWALKNWWFQIVVLEKTLKSPLHCKKIKPVNPKGSQPWIFIGRTVAEVPILWLPDVKSQLIGKDPDAGKNWRQEEKGTTELDSSTGKQYDCNAGDPSSIPGLGISPGDGIGYLLQYSWASLVAQSVKNLPTMREAWVQSLGWENPLEEGMATHFSILAWGIPMDRGAWRAIVHGVAKS